MGDQAPRVKTQQSTLISRITNTLSRTAVYTFWTKTTGCLEKERMRPSMLSGKTSFRGGGLRFPLSNSCNAALTLVPKHFISENIQMVQWHKPSVVMATSLCTSGRAEAQQRGRTCRFSFISFQAILFQGYQLLQSGQQFRSSTGLPAKFWLFLLESWDHVTF